MNSSREKQKLDNFSRKQKAKVKLIEDEQFNEFAHATAVRSCLPELPKLPKYFQNQLATNELEEVNDPDSFTIEQSIWSVWNFYHRLKVAALFIYKFIDNPTVASLYNEFPELEVNTRIARKIYNLPTVFFPASESQTAAIIFADPLKNFFLQFIVTSYICMEQFAQDIESVFTLDENNIFTAGDLELLRKFIRELNESFKLIEKAIETIKKENVLLFADTYDYEDENTFYLRIFREFEESNSLETYLNTASTSDKIWDEYDKEIEGLEDDSSFEKCAVEGKLNHELEEFFYGLLISEMSIFHTVKNAIDLPGVMDEEITLFLKSYDEKKNIEEKKDTEQRVKQQNEILEKFIINSDLVSYINEIKEIKNDDERTRSCRDFYYEIRDTLAVIFYIFKNIVEENPIKRNQQVREIVNSINELQRQINNNKSVKPVLEAEVPTVSAQPKPAHFPRKRQRNSKTKEKGVAQQTVVIKSETSATIATVTVATATIPDPKAVLNERYQAGLIIQEELETKADQFNSEYKRIFIALGAIKKSDKIDKELNGLKERFNAEVENPKNAVRGQAKVDLRDFDNAKYSVALEKNLTKWENSLKKLLEATIVFIKKLTGINDSLIKQSVPRPKAKRIETARQRTNSEKLSRNTSPTIAPAALTRSTSDIISSTSFSSVSEKDLEFIERLFSPRKLSRDESKAALPNTISTSSITPKDLNRPTIPCNSTADEKLLTAAALVPGFLTIGKTAIKRSLSEADATAIFADPNLLNPATDSRMDEICADSDKLIPAQALTITELAVINNIYQSGRGLFFSQPEVTESKLSEKLEFQVELANIQAELEFEDYYDADEVDEAIAALGKEEKKLEEMREVEELLATVASLSMADIEEAPVDHKIQTTSFWKPSLIRSNDWKSPAESSQNSEELDVSRLWNQL